MQKKLITAGVIVAVVLLCLFVAKQNTTINGDNEDTPKILVIAPLTGPGAALGVSSRTGMEMALEDLRAEGVQLELNFQDSKTNPSTAVSILASQSMHSNRKVFISEMSQVTRSLVAPAEQANLLMLSTLVGVPNIGNGSSSFVRINVMSDAIAPPLAKHAAKYQKKMAVLYLNDDYGRANRDLFVKTYTAAGGEVVVDESFERDPSSARILVEKVKQSEAKACFISGYGPVYPELFKVFKQLSPSTQIYADIGLANAPVFKAVGQASEGVILAATEVDAYPPVTEQAKKLSDRFTTLLPGKRPDYVVAYSYDTIRILAQALKAVPEATPKALREYLCSRSFNGYGGTFKIDPKSGDSIYDPLPLYQVHNGHIVRLKIQE